MTKKRLTVRLPEELSEQLSSIARNNGFSKNDIVVRAVNYFIENKGQSYPELFEVLGQSFNKYFKPITEELQSLRFASNQVAKESQMNNEFWNDHLLKHGDGNAITTDVKRANEYDQVSANIKNKILIKQQKKHS